MSEEVVRLAGDHLGQLLCSLFIGGRIEIRAFGRQLGVALRVRTYRKMGEDLIRVVMNNGRIDDLVKSLKEPVSDYLANNEEDYTPEDFSEHDELLGVMCASGDDYASSLARLLDLLEFSRAKRVSLCNELLEQPPPTRHTKLEIAYFLAQEVTQRGEDVVSRFSKVLSAELKKIKEQEQQVANDHEEFMTETIDEVQAELDELCKSLNVSGFSVKELRRRSESPGADPVFVPTHGGAFASASVAKAVEVAAVNAVIKFLSDDYEIEDRQKLNCGYDLLAKKSDGSEIHVEVKGTSLKTPRFFISRNEHDYMIKVPHWRLGMVTDALGHPKVEIIDRAETERRFDLEPRVYEARQRLKPN